jgi:ribosomal protein L24
MQKFHVKRGDQVVVLAGSQKGKSGKVLEIVAGKQRARVEGLAMIKKHEKKSEKNPQGAITSAISCSSRISTRANAGSPRRKPPPELLAKARLPSGPHACVSERFSILKPHSIASRSVIAGTFQ